MDRLLTIQTIVCDTIDNCTQVRVCRIYSNRVVQDEKGLDFYTVKKTKNKQLESYSLN